MLPTSGVIQTTNLGRPEAQRRERPNSIQRLQRPRIGGTSAPNPNESLTSYNTSSLLPRGLPTPRVSPPRPVLSPLNWRRTTKLKVPGTHAFSSPHRIAKRCARSLHLIIHIQHLSPILLFSTPPLPLILFFSFSFSPSYSISPTHIVHLLSDLNLFETRPRLPQSKHFITQHPN